MNNQASLAVINALYNCGQGRIEYTCGVLDALGHDDLSAEIKFANHDYRISRPAPSQCASIEEAICAPSSSAAYFAANARLNAAFERVEAISEAYREGRARA